MSDSSFQPGGSPIPTGDLVAVDGVTISGDGSVEHPLTAIDGGGTVITDGITIQGVGSHAEPVAIKAVQRDSTLSGTGAVGDPLHVVVAGGAGVAVEDEGVPLVGNPYATLDFVGAGVAATDVGGIVARVTVPGTVTVDGTTIAGDGQGTPLHVIGVPTITRVTYTATGSEGSDFDVPIGATLVSANYSVEFSCAGATYIIDADMPTADRTTSQIRVVTTSAPVAGDVLDFVLTL